MIELAMVSYLINDSSLTTLLGASGSDSHMYPIQIPHNVTLPCITYNIVAQGTLEENLKELQIAFNVCSDSYLESKNIRDRLLTLLDREDGIRVLITGTPYIFYWCKHTGGSSFVDSDVNAYHNVVIFSVKYAETVSPSVSSIIVPEVSLHKQMLITIPGTPFVDMIPYNSKPFSRNVLILGADIYAMDSPTGADLTLDIIQDDVELGKTMMLPDGQERWATTYTPFVFNTVNKFGLKVKTIGTTTPGQGVVVTILYI